MLFPEIQSSEKASARAAFFCMDKQRFLW